MLCLWPAQRVFTQAATSARLSCKRALSADSKLSTFAAERMGSMGLAASDPVEDYRVLAGAGFWNQVLGPKKELKCLDVCSGTGRWTQALSELVLQPRSMSASMDCVDLCEVSLAHLQKRLPQMPGIISGTTHCMDARTLESLGGKFDLATNMHGLYAIPRNLLREVVNAMVQATADGGTCIIALGDANSFYIRYSHALVACGVMESCYTAAEDVADVLQSLGVSFERAEINYVERTQNEAQLRHFLENESGGNTWPADDLRTGKALTSFVSPNVRKLIDAHAIADGVHEFPQSCLALVVRK